MFYGFWDYYRRGAGQDDRANTSSLRHFIISVVILCIGFCLAGMAFLYFYVYERDRMSFAAFWPTTQLTVLVCTLFGNLTALGYYYPRARERAIVAFNREGKTLLYTGILQKYEMAKAIVVSFWTVVFVWKLLPYYAFNAFQGKFILITGCFLSAYPFYLLSRLKMLRV